MVEHEHEYDKEISFYMISMVSKAPTDFKIVDVSSTILSLSYKVREMTISSGQTSSIHIAKLAIRRFEGALVISLRNIDWRWDCN